MHVTTGHKEKYIMYTATSLFVSASSHQDTSTFPKQINKIALELRLVQFPIIITDR